MFASIGAGKSPFLIFPLLSDKTSWHLLSHFSTKPSLTGSHEDPVDCLLSSLVAGRLRKETAMLGKQRGRPLTYERARTIATAPFSPTYLHNVQQRGMLEVLPAGIWDSPSTASVLITFPFRSTRRQTLAASRFLWRSSVYTIGRGLVTTEQRWTWMGSSLP
jgi:hypothetical protein